LDLEKFFDRVHHDRLMARLAQRIEDRRLLRLIRQMLKAKVVMPNGVVVATEEGAPQGGPLSPLLSNVVLDELDWELEERGHRFVRYADDANIYVRSERAGLRVMATVVQFIERRLRLKVNADKSAVAQPEKRHFVGFRLRHNWETNQVEVLPSKRSTDRLAAKIRRLTPRAWGRSFDSCISRANGYLRGWIGFFGICSPTPEVIRLLHSTDAHLRRRLRALLLRQWKRKRYIARHLIRMGARPGTAWRVVYERHKSLWALSHEALVGFTLSKLYFEQRGLLPVEILYRGQPRFVVAQEQLTLDLDRCGRKRRRRSKGLSSPIPRVPKSRM